MPSEPSVKMYIFKRPWAAEASEKWGGGHHLKRAPAKQAVSTFLVF